ncbi:hypothetical protein SAMN05216350_106257 [Polaromonas sp. YR568]|uniref:hypothetical protein n=1 Tax=Polaromonas sp. YR568 TaxID=1855301 RepID=UPI0008E19406|nr:hypothetical protein [Polaromonas sp. YR568]SFU86059.1 hypothetical protein SAMN05216350_106257 [Polaromonas sp. YR568]
MTSTHAPSLTSLASRCYRLTASGRACVDLVNTKAQTAGSLSRYLHDVLEMCGTGVWFEQLQQFMPPRSLDESLRSLLELGLIEAVDAAEAPSYQPPARRRTPSRLGDLTRV